MADRVIFLVDGFNLHFSAREAARALGKGHPGWLDLRSLLRSYLSVLDKGANVQAIHYFTAIPFHMHSHDPFAVRQHCAYLGALEGTGVTVHVASFKRKETTCPHCGAAIRRHEEKETDVSIGVLAMELLFLAACETLVFVSGDTDLAPAVRAAKRLFPKVRVCVAFPHGRFNAELQQLADLSFRLRAAQYARHTFPDPLRLPDGRVLQRPPAG